MRSGHTLNTSWNGALGVTVSGGVVNDGSRIAVEARRRYWTAERSSFDLSAGWVRMNVPTLPIPSITRRTPSQQRRQNSAGGRVGAGLGSYGAVGATLPFGVLVAAVAVAIARSGGDF